MGRGRRLAARTGHLLASGCRHDPAGLPDTACNRVFSPAAGGSTLTSG